MRLDTLIIILIERPQSVLILGGKQSNYWSQKKHRRAKTIRLDALIISLLNDHSRCLFFGGKQSKYWSREQDKQTKMRLDPLIIFLIEWLLTTVGAYFLAGGGGG